MNTLISILDNSSLFLSQHTVLSYVILFLGSYFETIVGPGFFVYGELFFIPGGIIAGTGALSIWWVALSAIGGGVLGDFTSYEIGRRSKKSFFKQGNKYFSPENHQKGALLFEKYGPKAIFFARLLGPLSWITPFLSGTYNIPRKTFFLYNIPAVIIGIGQFLLAGYIFGANYKTGLKIIQEKAVSIFSILLLLSLIYIIIKRNNPDFFTLLKEKIFSINSKE